MRTSVRVSRVAAASLLLLAVAAPAAFAYSGQIARTLTMNGPSGNVTCNSDVPVSTTVLDASGNAVGNQSVAWAFDAGDRDGDTVTTAATTTDGSGVASTSVRLACVAGQRTLFAHAGDAVGSLVLGVQAAGLPRTDTQSEPNWTLIASVLVAFLGFALASRRILVRR